MKTIILEGSSASGKTRTARKLVEICDKKNLNCLMVEESETLMPILHNRDEEVALEHILGILDEVYGQKRDQTSDKLRDSSTSLRFARNDTEKHRYVRNDAKIQYDIVIFDRLHLTPIAICKSSVAKFKEVEDELVKFNPVLIFLEMSEAKIPERVLDSIKYRSPSWGEYVHRKGSKEEIIEHYTLAQRKLQKLVKETKLPKIIFDSTDENFDRIAQEIASKCF